MPFLPQTKAQAADQDSESRLDEQPDADESSQPESNVSQPTPAWASYQGAVTHSLSWIQGKLIPGDTTLVNPHFQPTRSEHENNIEYSIYCIHGTGDSPYAFKKIVDRLLGNKPGEHVNWLPKSISKIHLLAFDGALLGETIEAYAEQLKSKIIKNQDKHVILFGHSRGGLVAARFTEVLARETGVNVHGVFAFCSPFSGSPWAVAPFTNLSSVAEMIPESEFLKDLQALFIAKTKEEDKKYFYFVAGQDSLVSAASSITEGHASNIISLPSHGHLSILTSSKILIPISTCLNTITARPLLQIGAEETPIKKVCLELEAELIALKYRSHRYVYSSEPKLKILDELKTLLSELNDGNRGGLFPEARTVGEVIHNYMQTVEPQTRRSYFDIIKQNLNPSMSSFSSFWRPAPSKSQIFIENLIRQCRDVPLPQANAPTREPHAASTLD